MWVLLLLPFVGLLWVPFYNFAEPSLFGFPFFYWYQLAWVPITSLLIWLVDRRRAQGGSGRACCQPRDLGLNLARGYRFSATNLLRRVPIPVMSISTTSPDFRSGEAPSVPIQITSPGHSVKYLVSSTMNGSMPKIMSLV